MNTVQHALDTLSHRFKIDRIILVADRDIASEKNLSLMKKRGYERIVGVKMRRLQRVRDRVLSSPGRYRKADDNLNVKEILRHGQRHIIGSNPKGAEKDRQERDQIVRNPQQKMATGSLSKVLRGDANRFCRIEVDRAVLCMDKIWKEARAPESLCFGPVLIRPQTR